MVLDYDPGMGYRYERIAEQVFGGINVDRFLLEYDSARAGGFEPLRFMPSDTSN